MSQSSPETETLRKALEKAREEIVLAVAFLGRDLFTDRINDTADSLVTRLAKADADARAALSSDHAQSSLEVRQHIAWLFQYVQGMNEQNWRDMKLRAERQLEQLSLEFPGPAFSSTPENSK